MSIRALGFAAPVRHVRAALVAALAPFALVVTGGASPAVAQSRHDPAAPRIEQAAIALVTMLDEGRYDEVVAKLRSDAARFGPNGLPAGVAAGAGGAGAITRFLGGVPDEAAVRSALEVRRERGRLSNRQTMNIVLMPLQSELVTGRPPGSTPRPFAVEFDSDPESGMLDRRRRPAPIYRESVGGYLMPDGALLVTSYEGSAQHSSDRVNAGASTGAGPATGAAISGGRAGNAAGEPVRGRGAAAAAAGSGTSGPEAVAIEIALDFAKLLDAGRDAEAFERIRTGSPALYGNAGTWDPTAQRLRDSAAKRAARGALSDRKVMLVSRDGGQGTYSVILGATGARAPVPPRYGPMPMASMETVRVQVFGGETRVLDYRFGH